MGTKVAYLVVDTVDPEALAPFWCAVLDVGVADRLSDGEYLLLQPTADGLRIAFQRVPESKAVKNRLHLDLEVDDLDEMTARVRSLGGRWEDEVDHRLGDYTWRNMQDPEGNEFDIIPAGD